LRLEPWFRQRDWLAGDPFDQAKESIPSFVRKVITVLIGVAGHAGKRGSEQFIARIYRIQSFRRMKGYRKI
jgi:hypothetical protein